MRKLPIFSILLSILIVACTAEKTSTKLSDSIRINQIGFYPNSVKQFIVADLEVTSFDRFPISLMNWSIKSSRILVDISYEELATDI